VRLFKGLPKKHLGHVKNQPTRIDPPLGRELTHEDGTGHEFIIVLDGEIEVRWGDDVVARCGAGDYVGEIALIDNGPRTATVAATATVLEVIGQQEFAGLLAPRTGDR
jgi:CRP-like cAMP-binding protein